MDSKLVKVLKFAGQPLTAREAYNLQWEVLIDPWDQTVTNWDGITDHDVVTYSYGMFTSMAYQQVKAQHPKVKREHNGKVWVYSLI